MVPDVRSRADVRRQKSLSAQHQPHVMLPNSTWPPNHHVDNYDGLASAGYALPAMRQ